MKLGVVDPDIESTVNFPVFRKNRDGIERQVFFYTIRECDTTIGDSKFLCLKTGIEVLSGKNRYIKISEFLF